MKKILSVLCIATLLFASCSDEYDDSALTGRVDNLENRVAKLEELCKQMNTNISSLQTIVTALQKNDYITSVTPIMQNGKEVGYTIAFSKSNPIAIYHGKDGADGKDGKDGHTPVIGVKQDTDGSYYWTLDGDWLTDDSGNKIKIEGTDGQDGVTPRLKIEEGCWYISYDNEQPWSPIDGNSDVADCIFTDIEDLSDQVIFYLKDGTTIVLPKQIQEEFLNITFGDIEKLLFPGMTHEIEYVISGADEQTIIEVVAQDNYKAHVQPIDNRSGKIIIQAPTTDLVDSRILVFVSKQQQTIMRVIRTTEGIFSVTSDAYEVEYTSAELSITVEANIDYTLNIDPEAQEWLSL